MTQLEAAAFWVGLNALFLIVLSARVGLNRLSRKIDLGDGGVPEMTRAIRAHGNYIEYAPAALGGIVIPLILTKLGVDPAVSSGPFVTTITDVVGFFSFLGIATLWFRLG